MNEHIENKSDWDLVIEPRKSLFDLNLRELWQYRDLIMLFVRRDFVAQYKQTILGPVWHILQPILTTIMFLLVFGKIANIPTDGIEPVLFYMSGITVWNFFSLSLTNTANTFIVNAAIFGKVYFPRLVIPISVVLSNIIRFGIQFVLLFVAMVFFAIFRDYPINVGSNLFLLPIPIFLTAGISLGLGIIISSLTTKYRDFTVLISFAVQLLMYATPVAYPLSFLKNKSFANLIEWNPLTSIVEGFRFALFNVDGFAPISLFYPFLFMLVTLFIGALVFNKVESTFMDTV